MPARTLMVQGTASSVGKSVLVAALCRIFVQDGLRVAPFKSQNMALNSYVTRDGGEMGRAQVVQAEAAGIAPTVDMNPILLKPEGDARCQVIVRGKVYRTLSAGEYYEGREQLFGLVQESLERLRSAYDLVIIEGAGSPAEVNLKDGEIVNMRIARLAEAPVLLVGDIDRGGVFAALVGTLELLDPDERTRVRGLVINKFRGDINLLGEGLEFLARRTGVPVLGVVPFFRDIKVAEEDSVSLEGRQNGRESETWLDICIVHVPRISNYDDFDPLEQENGVQVRYVQSAAQLGRPDLIILPGTKHTIGDLQHLKRAGLADGIRALAGEGTPVIGICGGFQMLGATIRDPQHVESSVEEESGIGLLPVITTFAGAKTTHQTRARVLADRGLLAGAAGQEVTGYEIHMGESAFQGAGPALEIVERSGAPVRTPDGAISADGLIFGTYLHGLFANRGLRHALLDALARRKGLHRSTWAAGLSKEIHYDRLAAHVRASLDMDLLRQIVGL